MRTVKIALQQAQPRLASSDPLRFAARAGRTARGLFPCAATSTLAGRARAGQPPPCRPRPVLERGGGSVGAGLLHAIRSLSSGQLGSRPSGRSLTIIFRQWLRSAGAPLPLDTPVSSSSGPVPPAPRGRLAYPCRATH